MTKHVLLPCPFCGGDAQKFVALKREIYSCSVEGCPGYGTNCTPEQWNTRTHNKSAEVDFGAALDVLYGRAMMRLEQIEVQMNALGQASPVAIGEIRNCLQAFIRQALTTRNDQQGEK